MPAPLGQGNCQYTAITTIGTQTVDPGATAADPGAAGRYGVLYGFNLYAAGTAAVVVTYYDVVTNQATGVVSTNTLLSGTASAAGANVAPPGNVGIRYKGTLLLITTGTAGSGNTLWD